MVVVIIILAVITTVAMRSLQSTSDIARLEQTRAELDQLAHAIAGNPALVSGGVRTDFGYVGDVGSMPPSLSALVTNPGLATWDGPYIHDDFYLSVSAAESEFRIDAWGQPYQYSGGVSITSTGSGQNLTRRAANNTDDLLYNSVTIIITDLNHTPPGTIYRDSVQIEISYPNGLGAITTAVINPGADGFAQLDSLPVGIHPMIVVYVPDADTLTRRIAVIPGQSCHIETQLYEDLW